MACHPFVLRTACLAAALLLGVFPVVHSIRAAEVMVNNRTDLHRALQSATPGTIIRVAPGKYQGGLSASKLEGLASQPIIITGADPEKPPLFEGGSSGIQLSGCSHVELRDLHFTGATGNGINIDDGGDRSEPSRGIVLKRLLVSNVGPEGNRDGIKLSGLDGFTVDQCRVERWGRGGSAIDMVGCHEGLIENCTFVHDPGPASASANGVQTKGGSRDIVIRRCHFTNAGGRSVNVGGSTGIEFMRPPNPGHEAKDITVEDCYFIGSTAPVAFVGVDGAVFQHNTIYRPERWILRILQENQAKGFAPCRNGIFRGNLVVFFSKDLAMAANIGSGTRPETFRFENNAWFCADAASRTRSMVRLPVEETGGVYGIGPDFNDTTAGDLSNARDNALKNHGVREP